MAGFFQEFFKDVGKGFLNNDYLRDYTHASKTFVSNAYGYAPKHKFSFHVYFELNSSYIPSLLSDMPTDHNFGLTVKSVQLPKYTFDLTTMNQYNRKRIIQTKVKYDPVSISFHDDNSNLITKLWHKYYTYYYKDGVQADPIITATSSVLGSARNAGSANAQDINIRTLYEPSIAGNDDWGYVGEPDTVDIDQGLPSVYGLTVKVPFFRSINVYGFNQHNFTLHRFINPMIQSFAHDTYDYKESGGVMEHQMTIDYETVKYYQGAIDGKSPSQIVSGFGDAQHYDRTVSPIALPGSNSTILGQGGLIDGAGGLLEDLSNGNLLSAAKKAATLSQTFKNPASIINAAKGDALGAANDWLKSTPNRNNLFNFPLPQSIQTPQAVATTANELIKTGVNNLTTKVNLY